MTRRLPAGLFLTATLWLVAAPASAASHEQTAAAVIAAAQPADTGDPWDFAAEDDTPSWREALAAAGLWVLALPLAT